MEAWISQTGGTFVLRQVRLYGDFAGLIMLEMGVLRDYTPSTRNSRRSKPKDVYSTTAVAI